jgi:hypothetical protein
VKVAGFLKLDVQNKTKNKRKLSVKVIQERYCSDKVVQIGYYQTVRNSMGKWTWVTGERKCLEV